MPRPKAFDPGQALDSALQCFKQHGFNGASLSTLTSQMGLGRASLYATYGDKRSLFLAALSDYADATIGYFERRLATADDVLGEIRSLVRDIASMSACAEGRFGCFLVNATSELAANDDEVRAFVERSFLRMENAYYDALVRAQRHGALAADKDPRVLARFLFTTVVGLRVVGKTRPDQRMLGDVAETIVACLGE
jgi:TetR/AcrR family transcriptional repressor of nem operon